MKKLIFALASVVLLAAAVAQAETVNGQVVKVDQAAGKITIKHGPIKKFDMDMAMTMVFRAKDAAMFSAVKVGDKVEFEPEQINGQFTIVKIEKVK